MSVEDELVTFRTKWQQEIQQPKVKPTSKQSRPSASPNEVPKYDNYSEEDIARNYFNKGIILDTNFYYSLIASFVIYNNGF